MRMKNAYLRVGIPRSTSNTYNVHATMSWLDGIELTYWRLDYEIGVAASSSAAHA